MSSPLPGVSRRILQYLDRISEKMGKPTRMDFLRIAGNESNLNDWVKYLIKRNLIREDITAPDEKERKTTTYYIMSDYGKKVREILRNYNYLGPLFGDLSRERRRRQ